MTKTYATSGPKESLKPFEITRRKPGPHDVAIDIKFSGICHSDIHQARDEWGGSKFPMVPGHEIAGVVTAVGSKVTKFKVGDHAGVGCMVDSCRKCEACKEGVEQYCHNAISFTYNSTEQDGKTPTYGGYSQHIVTDENYVIQIPKNLKLDVAAPLLCAGITLYSPLKHWNAGPGKKVAIMGLGGLGHMGVKLAHAMGAEVTVLSQTNKKKEDALKMGAHHFYATSDGKTFETCKRSFDLILNTVSAELDWNLYLNLLKRDGTLVLLGVPAHDAPPVHAFTLIGNRTSLAGSVIGGIAETQEMIDFCAKHNITPEIETIKASQINEAYERMIKGDVRYRFVIDAASF